MSRVLSIRFAQDEYETLQALSLVTGLPINALVREAVNEKVDRAADDPEISAMAEEMKRRVEAADRALRRRVASV